MSCAALVAALPLGLALADIDRSKIDVREGIGRVAGVACKNIALADAPAPRLGLFKRKKAR